MNWAREKGIISGKGGNRFDPRGQATRAEMAAMLMRWVQGKGETPTPSPDPSPPPDPSPSPAPNQGNTLIAYFSCTNNTENIANHLKTALPNADLYEITPSSPTPVPTWITPTAPAAPTGSRTTPPPGPLSPVR